MGAVGHMGRLVKLSSLAFLIAFALAGVLALCADAGAAFADSHFAVYGGWNDSFDSDITLKQPSSTDLTLSDVPWDGA